MPSSGASLPLLASQLPASGSKFPRTEVFCCPSAFLTASLLASLAGGLRGAERGSHPPTQDVSIFPLLVFLSAGLRWSEQQICLNKSLLLGGLQL